MRVHMTCFDTDAANNKLKEHNEKRDSFDGREFNKVMIIKES